MKRRIRIEWTCSDFATHHRHRTWFGAWLCGRAQWMRAALGFALALLSLASPAWAQKPTVIISGDGAATVVSVGTQGPPGANIPAGGSEGQGICKSGAGLGWCQTFVCTGGACTFTTPILSVAADNCAAPPFSFLGQTTSGFCSSATGTVNLRVGGANQFSQTMTAITVTVPINGLSWNYTGPNSFYLGAGASAGLGQGNLSIGDSAGASLTTGWQNVLIGWLAGDAITTGTENVALGRAALSGILTGASNVGIGHGSLQNCVTCSYNTALGKSALGTGALQNGNVAIGYQAGLNNNANSNIYVGSGAGSICQTGIESVLVGAAANCAAAGSERVLAIGPGATATTNSISIGRNASEPDQGEITIQAYNGSRLSTDSFQGSKLKALADATATAFVRLSVADDDYEGCHVIYTAYAEDTATDARQTRTGGVYVAITNNSGTEAAVFSAGDSAVSVTAGTFTCAFDGNSAVAGTIDLRANCDTSLAAITTLTFEYRLDCPSAVTVTPL